MTKTILNENESHCGSLTLEKCSATRKIKLKRKSSSSGSLVFIHQNINIDSS
jgi:hypothetical protein